MTAGASTTEPAGRVDPPALSPAALAVRYAWFAAVATLLNIAAQSAGLYLYDGPYALTLAMAAGTGVGLLAKYQLDRKWIFFDRARSAREHGATFGLYTVMGVVTTAIFWGAELAAHAIHPDLALVGATLGLAVGYVVKYRLDRRFVFGGGQG